MLTKDSYTDYDKIYAEFTIPKRGGILSEPERANPRVTKERLRKDAYAILWSLHWAVYDIVSARTWARGLSEDNNHYRKRLEEVWGLLTDEQKAEMGRRDDARRLEKENVTK
jgi:hypothetical protein